MGKTMNMTDYRVGKGRMHLAVLSNGGRAQAPCAIVSCGKKPGTTTPGLALQRACSKQKQQQCEICFSAVEPYKQAAI